MAEKVVVENKGIYRKIIHFEKHIGQSHDAKGIGVQLVTKDPKKGGHFSDEEKDGKLESTAKLILEEGVVTIGGLVSSDRRTRNDDGVGRREVSKNPKFLISPGMQSASHDRKPGST